MKMFSNLKALVMMFLFAIATIGAVPVYASGLAFTNADLQSAQVIEKKNQEIEKMAPMPKFLTILCGERKDGISFTQEELAILVLTSTASEKMQPAVCRMFKDTKFL